jgi:uncharacterized membrane protein
MDLLLVGGAALWCSAILAAPYWDVAPLYMFFSIICHQQPARSWTIAGEPLAVCIRCTAIYFGFFAGLLFHQAPNVRWLKIALALTAAEFVFALVIADVALLRFVSGALLGAAAAPIVRSGIEQMFARFAHEAM